jgi:hypothetical protein
MTYCQLPRIQEVRVGESFCGNLHIPPVRRTSPTISLFFILSLPHFLFYLYFYLGNLSCPPSSIVRCVNTPVNTKGSMDEAAVSSKQTGSKIAMVEDVKCDVVLVDGEEFIENTEEERALLLKIDLWMMPAIWFLYLFSYLVRTPRSRFARCSP